MLQERTNPIAVICFTGLVAEFVLPWAVIWLSDMFFLDIPKWSLWLLFGGPPALSLAAVLIHLALRTWLKASRVVQGRLNRKGARTARTPEPEGRKPGLRGLQASAGHRGPDRETNFY